MSELLTKEMKDAVKVLADLILADKRYQESTAAAEAYNNDAEVIRMITEYNVHQTALTEEYAKETREDNLIISIQKRIDALYEAITTADSYQNFVRAKEESDALVKAVTDELEYALTGRRPCTHNCASCHADCASKSAETDSAQN
ncbi:MAG: YlbF family regulator [Clostridia bacterium]|nr:YlbF family regulator [Clostridia bacterium]